ncbi:MAG: GNAT family N-acetyltransferase [Alphaproteobacteria bacterium]|nr:GNAT family N-acetyltransferase [Alphaproteobacteria bacterium]
MNAKTRHRVLTGKTADLVPVTEEHLAAIVRLRNLPHVRAYFDEQGETTLESQTAFFRGYLESPDDLYWAVRLKSGKVIGTNRLNEIDGKSGCKGSQIVDEEHGRLGPYALESEILLLRFAFEVLELEQVRAIIRPDNEKVISFNYKLGLKKIRPYEMRGRMYDEYILDRADFHPEKYEPMFDYFAKRGA